MSATKSGEFTVYHVSEAGDPAAHATPGGGWFYQPTGEGSGDVYSDGYPTEAAALAAAEEEEAQQKFEEEAEEEANAIEVGDREEGEFGPEWPVRAGWGLEGVIWRDDRDPTAWHFPPDGPRYFLAIEGDEAGGYRTLDEAIEAFAQVGRRRPRS